AETWTAISGRGRPFHESHQCGTKKPSLNLGLLTRPSVYQLPDSRSLHKRESHPRAKETRFCHSMLCYSAPLCSEERRREGPEQRRFEQRNPGKAWLRYLEGTQINMAQEYIEIRGARENNLKDVSLRLPKRRITIFTGVSGSGKSSLVFDTIANEAQ